LEQSSQQIRGRAVVAKGGGLEKNDLDNRPIRREREHGQRGKKKKREIQFPVGEKQKKKWFGEVSPGEKASTGKKTLETGGEEEGEKGDLNRSLPSKIAGRKFLGVVGENAFRRKFRGGIESQSQEGRDKICTNQGAPKNRSHVGKGGGGKGLKSDPKKITLGSISI